MDVDNQHPVVIIITITTITITITMVMLHLVLVTYVISVISQDIIPKIAPQMYLTLVTSVKNATYLDIS